MENDAKIEIPAVLSQFLIEGECLSLSEITAGHIHRTYLGTWSTGSRYVHQRFNDAVFPDIHAVNQNIQRVLSHLQAKGCAGLQMIPVRSGGSIVHNDSYWWRTFAYIENTQGYSICNSVELAYQAAKTFGSFQADLADLPAGSLADPIPHFMDCKRRLDTLQAAARDGLAARVEAVAGELAFVAAQAQKFNLIAGGPPTSDHRKRPTHGDMKLNNLLFEAGTTKPVCVIDLDTCMEGSYLFDFGDMVRTACAAAKEDEPDLQKVTIRLDLFEGLAAGYAEAMRGGLTRFEREHLVAACELLPLTVGVRFLTDFLQGDSYFRIEYPEHNLVRARAQFELARKIDEQREEMAQIIERKFSGI